MRSLIELSVPSLVFGTTKMQGIATHKTLLPNFHSGTQAGSDAAADFFFRLGRSNCGSCLLALVLFVLMVFFLVLSFLGFIVSCLVFCTGGSTGLGCGTGWQRGGFGWGFF